MKRKSSRRNVGITIAAAAVAAIAIATALSGLPQAGGAGPGPSGGSPEAGAAAGPPAEGGSPPADAGSSEEWPGQSQGYVGPNGEGVLDPENFESDGEYVEALIGAGGKEVDIEKEPVFTTETAGYFKGWLCVNFYRSCGEECAREIIASTGGMWVSSTFAWSGSGDVVLVDAYYPDRPYKEALLEVAEKLTAMDEVESAHTDIFEKSQADDSGASFGLTTTNDPSASSQYWLLNSGFSQAWSIVQCDGSVEVAVFDSGMDLDHEDLAENVSVAIPYDAYNQCALQGADQDTSGHGTMVCGIVSAVANNEVGIVGSSYNAGLVPVRVNSAGPYVDWHAVDRAFDFVFSLTNRPEVINMSFGGTYLSDDTDPDIVALRTQIQGRINTARSSYGITCVAAAGNNAGTTEFYPAKFSGVIGVSAVNSDSTFASGYSNHNSTVDICASGTNIYSTTNPDHASTLYGSDSGTSFAAPQVAAAAALLKAQHPAWTAQQVEDRLEQTARDLGDPGRDDLYGHGALDAQAAVAAAPSPSPNTGGGLPAPEGAVAYRQGGVARADIPAALSAAMEANPDVVAWLEVPGTNVSMPVCRRAGDGAYYLTHGPDGSELSVGCPFVDARNAPDLSDPVTVVYGHTFSDAPVAFTQLHRFEDAAFFGAHGEFRVHLPGRTLTYRIASTCTYTDVDALSEFDLSRREVLQGYLDFAVSPGGAASNVRGVGRLDASADRVVQLSTCTLPYDAGARFVVTGVLVAEDGA